MNIQKQAKRLISIALFALTLAIVTPFAINAQGKNLTYNQKDRETIIKSFMDTHENFEKAIRGLSKEQLAFRPHEKSWTVAEVGEHIVLTETALRSMIDAGPLKSALNKDAGVFRINDGIIVLAITNRGQKFNAPEFVQPKKALSTVDDLINGMKKARMNNVNFLKSTQIDLRNHFSKNPLIGMIDGVQWFLFLNSHAERHLAQIAEIKSHKDYPSK